MRYGVYFFFAGMEFIMTFFIMFFTPESKGIPLEEVHEKFRKHVSGVSLFIVNIRERGSCLHKEIKYFLFCIMQLEVYSV